MIPSLRVKSLDPLLREMQKLSLAAQGRIGRNATMAAARLAARHARATAPVYSGPPRVKKGRVLPPGRLKRSIKARRGKNPALRGRAVAFVNAAVRYAHLVEYGTAHSAAKPFLRPSVDEHQPELLAKMAENIERGLRRELAKLSPPPEDPGEL